MGAGSFPVTPTDAAFAKFPAGTVESFLKDIPQLTKILTYCVVADKVVSAKVVKLNSVSTVKVSLSRCLQ